MNLPYHIYVVRKLAGKRNAGFTLISVFFSLTEKPEYKHPATNHTNAAVIL